MLLLIDNYDSFTYNLVHYLGELGAQTKVVRNDALDVQEALALRPSGILLSPGPCDPDQAGICLPLTLAAADAGIPLMGVCLGHQTIGQAFGGQVVRCHEIVHGKMGQISHGNSGLFEGLPSPFAATRYHSLVVDRAHLPDCLKVTAELEDGTIMGLAHRSLPIHGVQFHPESIRSEHGHACFPTFSKLSRWQHERRSQTPDSHRRRSRADPRRSRRGIWYLVSRRSDPKPDRRILMALRTRGETVEEYAAAASVMRAKCNAVTAPEGAMDIVGTGGDGMGTLNISTATALWLQARAFPWRNTAIAILSSKSGAADALGQMGVDVMVGPDVVERALKAAALPS